jgi:hypothetical protein
MVGHWDTVKESDMYLSCQWDSLITEVSLKKKTAALFAYQSLGAPVDFLDY